MSVSYDDAEQEMVLISSNYHNMTHEEGPLEIGQGTPSESVFWIDHNKHNMRHYYA